MQMRLKLISFLDKAGLVLCFMFVCLFIFGMTGHVYFLNFVFAFLFFF